jgi:hypothetical protein
MSFLIIDVISFLLDLAVLAVVAIAVVAVVDVVSASFLLIIVILSMILVNRCGVRGVIMRRLGLAMSNSEENKVFNAEKEDSTLPKEMS